MLTIYFYKLTYNALEIKVVFLKKNKYLIQYCQVTIFLLVFKMKFKLLIDKFKLLIDDKTAITLRKIHVPASVLPYIIEKTINARL